MAVTHVNGILGWHHIPQSITAENDVTMPFGIKSHHSSVRFWRNHKLSAVEIIAPEITCPPQRSYSFISIQDKFMGKNLNGAFLTKGPGYSQERDLVDDCTPPDRTVMGQSGPLPDDTVHTRFLHYTTE